VCSQSPFRIEPSGGRGNVNKLPRALGIYLCKRIAIDPAIGEMSLVGLFSAMTFDRWPSPIQRFTVYAVLYNGDGEGTIEVRIVRTTTEEEIYRFQRWTRIPDAVIGWPLEVPVKSCQFPSSERV
jgi:hypothetical protein